MIVAFGRRSSRSSLDSENESYYSNGNTTPSRVVRKIKSERYNRGSMIVSFAERRRLSSDSGSLSRPSAKSITSRRNKVECEQRSSSIAAAAIGPPSSSIRRTTTSRSNKSTDNSNSNFVEHKPSGALRRASDVIVEFPQCRRPSSTSSSAQTQTGSRTRRRRETTSLSGSRTNGMFRNDICYKEQPQRPIKKESKNKQPSINKQSSSTNKHRERRRHTRQFNDSFDWKDSSIDWGDCCSDNETKETADGSSNGEVPPRLPEASSRPDPIGHRSRAQGGRARRNGTGLDDSHTSLLSQSLSSLLSIRKSDP